MLPSNSSEAIFSQLYIIVSALFVSLLTSSLAAMFIRAQMATHDKSEKLRILTTYLDQNRINPILSMSVRNQVSYALTKQARLYDKDVPCLSLLSKNLYK